MINDISSGVGVSDVNTVDDVDGGDVELVMSTSAGVEDSVGSAHNEDSSNPSSRRSSSIYWNMDAAGNTILPRFEMYVRTQERRASQKSKRKSVQELFQVKVDDKEGSPLSISGASVVGSDAPSTMSRRTSRRELKQNKKQAKPVKFGMFEGVFARCLLNIWGVIMFLRIGWMIAHGGTWQATSIVVVAMTVTVITTLSLSAICTNGIIGGGGAYYLLSRSLGPEFGGAIGVLFSLANATAVALHLIGFAETIVGVFPDDTALIGDGSWDLRLIAVACLVFLICIALVGVAWVVKFQLVLLVLLVASIFAYFVGTFTHTPKPDYAIGYVGYNSTNLNENYDEDWSLKGVKNVVNIATESWITLFAVFFPASTGIMAGANISGDLKDAQRAIPIGTMAAVLVSGFIYICIIWTLGATVNRYGLAGCINLANDTLCDGGDGDNADDKNLNFLVMMDISVWPPLIVIGIVASSSVQPSPRF